MLRGWGETRLRLFLSAPRKSLQEGASGQPGRSRGCARSPGVPGCHDCHRDEDGEEPHPKPAAKMRKGGARFCGEAGRSPQSGADEASEEAVLVIVF